MTVNQKDAFQAFLKHSYCNRIFRERQNAPATKEKQLSFLFVYSAPFRGLVLIRVFRAIRGCLFLPDQGL
jgi:hypothetical protein